MINFLKYVFKGRISDPLVSEHMLVKYKTLDKLLLHFFSLQQKW